MPRKKFDRSLLPQRPNLDFELKLWSTGVTRIAGIDEAGRGALAGPVCAAAVVLPSDAAIEGTLAAINDSKLMRVAAREAGRALIESVAVCYGVGFASPAEIDEIGILPATRLAAMRALTQCVPAPEELLIDHITLPGAGLPAQSLVKGDMRSLSIACASVLAKTARDAVMVELDAEYPGYGFAQHKGYGTAAHREAITELGASGEHRVSWGMFQQESS